jgi:hypothetical protein
VLLPCPGARRPGARAVREILAERPSRRDAPRGAGARHAGEGRDGGLFANGDGSSWIITFNLRSNSDRQRFTKAHELGHYVLHRHERSGFRCENGAIGDRNKADALIESQANQFASYLLMPADEVRQQLLGQPITFHLLSRSATFFGVSLEAMCIR